MNNENVCVIHKCYQQYSMIRSSSSSSIPFYNNQSITQTSTLKEGTQFSPSLDSSRLDYKIESVTAGLQDHFVNLLKK